MIPSPNLQQTCQAAEGCLASYTSSPLQLLGMLLTCCHAYFYWLLVKVQDTSAKIEPKLIRLPIHMNRKAVLIEHAWHCAHSAGICWIWWPGIGTYHERLSTTASHRNLRSLLVSYRNKWFMFMLDVLRCLEAQSRFAVKYCFSFVNMIQHDIPFNWMSSTLIRWKCWNAQWSHPDSFNYVQTRVPPNLPNMIFSAQECH